MGLRLWIKTKESPVFSLRVQWFFMNQSYEFNDGTYWFFQDEWDEDFSLYSVAGYNKNDPHGELQRDYYKNHVKLINRLVEVTPDKIDNYFTESWERPTVFWDIHRVMAIAYLEAKVSYLKSLVSAGIVDTKSAFDVEPEILKDLPCWYEYRYTGPEKRLPRIPGKVTELKDI
jgi:hypothetical protein